MKSFYKFSPKLIMWYHQSLLEKGLTNEELNYIYKHLDNSYAIYPKSFYERILGFDYTKKYDYCFIGALNTDESTRRNRDWIIKFIKNKFQAKSYLQFTDKKTRENYLKEGSFDFTNTVDGIVPKELPIHKRNDFDYNYFSKMCNSCFTLCPAGDQIWSMRFYESLMCRSIPIVNTQNETFRSKEESEIPYKYFMANEEHFYDEELVEYNYRIFLKYHTLDSYAYRDERLKLKI